MSDETPKKTIIPTEDQRKRGNVIYQTAQQIDPAGRHRVDVNASAEGDLNTKQPAHLPQDTEAKPQGAVEHADNPDDQQDAPKPVRDAGPKEMQNPPRKWTREDEESDESFPASDPPGNY